MKVRFPRLERHRNAAKRYDSNAVAWNIESIRPEFCYFTFYTVLNSVRQFVITRASREYWKSASLTTLRGVLDLVSLYKKKKDNKNRYIAYTWLQNAQHWGVVKHGYLYLYSCCLQVIKRRAINTNFIRYMYMWLLQCYTLVTKLRIHVNLDDAKQKNICVLHRMNSQLSKLIDNKTILNYFLIASHTRT